MRLLKKKHKDICKTDRNYLACGFVLNMIAGMLNAAQSVVFIIFATRMNFFETAGNLTIAFAISNLLLTLGKFGMRNFQVTDASGQFSFRHYLDARKITTSIMLLCGFLLCVVQKYVLVAETSKVYIIFYVLLMYLFESYEDVYEAELQKKGRLDIASIIYIIRWILTFLGYGIAFIAFRKIQLALSVACIINGTSCFYMIFICKRCGLVTLEKRSGYNSWLVICKNISLCLSSFLIMFIANSPKYVVDLKFSPYEQTCFGIVTLPIFVIELMSNFFFQPYLHTMAQHVRKKNYKPIYVWMIKQCIGILVMTFVIMIGAYWLGIPILSLLYTVDLTTYHMDLLLVMIGSGLLAYATYFGVVLTIVRKQKYMLYFYFAASVIGTWIMYNVSDSYYIHGVIISYDITLALLDVVLLICLILNLKKCQKLSKLNNKNRVYED